MRRLFVLPLILAVGVACGRSKESRWDDRVAKVSCKTLRRCDPITFHRDYGSLSTCIDATEAEDHDECTYDRKAARRCIRAMKWNCAKIGRRYDDLVERCDAVWTCDAPDTSDDSGEPTSPVGSF